MAGYRDLKIWQLGIEITLDIYRLTSQFPDDERYGLTSQLRRAAVSVPSNIAEGHARKTPKEMARYASIAKGSLAEVETQLIIAGQLQYSAKEKLDSLLQKCEQESRMLGSFIRSQKPTP